MLANDSQVGVLLHNDGVFGLADILFATVSAQFTVDNMICAVAANFRLSRVCAVSRVTFYFSRFV